MTITETKHLILKALLKRPQTAQQLSERIGKGLTIKHLARPLGELLDEGAVAIHEGRVPRYSKI